MVKRPTEDKVMGRELAEGKVIMPAEEAIPLSREELMKLRRQAIAMVRMWFYGTLFASHEGLK